MRIALEDMAVQFKQSFWLVLGLNGGRIIRGRIIPSNTTVSYDEQVKMPV